MLSLESLDFAWGARRLFSGVSLTLEPGLCWLRGANGSGKTTLLRLFAGALTAPSGRIRLAGFDVRADPLAYRSRCFWANRDALAMDWLCAREFAELNLGLYRASSTGRARWLRLVEDLALNDQLETPLGALSLGQGQKLLLSIGLALDVDLLLLDEPFNGLDAPALTRLLEALDEPERRTTQIVVLSSHGRPALAIDRELDLDAAALGVAGRALPA